MKKSFLLIMLAIYGFQITYAQENTANSSYHPDFKAVYWYQLSGEMKALYYQGYSLATLRLEAMKNESSTLPKAVVLDLDETVLDNSPYQAFSIKEQIMYPTGWTEWINLANATSLPGAKEFLIKAKEMGVEPIYITNRKDSEKAKTIENLKKLGLPNASEEFVFTRSKTSDKTERRNEVSKKYSIVLLIGDNLGDFDEVFQDKANSLRKNLVDEFRNKFASKFIILPNPMYGEWEGAGFGFDYSKPLFRRYSTMKDSLNVADM